MMIITPKHSDFPSDEYRKRCEKAQKLMEKHRFDALLLSSKENVSYFTGFRKTQVGKTRGRFLILPREGDPALILPPVEKNKAEEMSWLFPDRIQIFDGARVIEGVGEAIKNLRVEEGNIGIEWDGTWASTRVEMSLSDYEDLKSKLYKANLLDSGELLWEMRVIKSSREVECIRKACKITYKSLKVALESLREGMAERELLKVFFMEMVKRGGFDDPLNAFCHIKSGVERSSIYDPRATKRKIMKGDIIQFDCGATFKGYFADMIRSACIHPSKKQQELFDIVVKACEKGYEMLMPGTRIVDVISNTLDVIRKAGYEPRLGVGHGIGLDVHEPPVLRSWLWTGKSRPHGDGLLHEGMVLAIEPAFFTGEGGFSQEDNVLITKTGPENLTPLDKKLKW